MPKARFDDKAFRKHLGDWIAEVDDDHFSRTWEVIVACLAVHAKLDREPKQSRAQAMREAYEDFMVIYDGEPGTDTMIGMMEELRNMCPEELMASNTFDVMMRESAAVGYGEDITEVAPEVAQSPPLRVLEGGKA